MKILLEKEIILSRKGNSSEPLLNPSLIKLTLATWDFIQTIVEKGLQIKIWKRMTCGNCFQHSTMYKIIRGRGHNLNLVPIDWMS